MSFSKSYNKNTGVTYVYEVLENKWDPVKKRAVNKRKLIGKIDPETGKVVPTRKKGQSASTSLVISPDIRTAAAVPADEIIRNSESLKQFLASQASYLKEVIATSQSQLSQIQNLLDSLEQNSK